MVVEQLHETLLVRYGLDLELRRVDVGELRAETVAATGHYHSCDRMNRTLLGRVVKVRSGEQLAENEGGNIHVVFGMDGNGNAITVVEDGDGVGRTIHGYLDCGHFGAALFVVNGIHENFVEYFNQSGILPMIRKNG